MKTKKPSKKSAPSDVSDPDLSQIERLLGFMAEHNPAALAETSRRFLEAIDRGLWRPRRNSPGEDLTRWSTP